MHACQRPFGESPKNHPFLWMQASLTKRRLNLYILGHATQKPTRKDAIWHLTFVNFWESNRWTVAWKSFCCYVFGIIDLAFLYQIPLFSLAIFHQSYSTGFFSSISKRYDQVVNKGDSFRSRQSSLNSSIECLSQVFKSHNPPLPEVSLRDSLSQVFFCPFPFPVFKSQNTPFPEVSPRYFLLSSFLNPLFPVFCAIQPNKS